MSLLKVETKKSSSVFVSENFPSSEPSERDGLQEIESQGPYSDSELAHSDLVKPINEIFICFGHEDFFDGYQEPVEKGEFHNDLPLLVPSSNFDIYELLM